jgi:hypothetical protein
MTASRGVTRHEKFPQSVARLSRKIPRIAEIVEGAIWAIARNPEFGVKNAIVGVWQATLHVSDDHDSPRVLLFYVFNRRHVRFLTVTLDASASN